MVLGRCTPQVSFAGEISRAGSVRHERQGRIRWREKNARHHFQLAACQAAETVSRDYRHGAVESVEGMHWSCSFGAVIAYGAVGAYADAQQVAGDSVQVRAGLISQVTGAITSADADDEHGQGAGYCSCEEDSQRQDPDGEVHLAHPLAVVRRGPVSYQTTSLFCTENHVSDG